MGSIVAVLLAIVLHGVAQSGGPAPRVCAWCCLPLVLLPYVAALLAHRFALDGRFLLARRVVVATENLGWIAYGIALMAFGWLEVVGLHGDFDGWPDARLFASFAPFVAYQIAALHASVLSHGGTRRTRRHLFAFQLRMFLACLAPLAMFVAASALVGQSEWLRVQVEYVGLAGALFSAGFVTLVAFSFPTLLRVAWDTAPFPEGPRREALDAIAARARFVPRAVRLWRTGDLIANATIVGIGARQRVVLFSDQLVSMLNVRELCAVYAHEIGHARRGHVGLFLSYSIGFVLLADVAIQEALDALGAAAAITVGLVALGLWAATFGWLSRRCELDADLFALETSDDLPALVSALERVAGSHRSRHGWRHFSVDRRIAFLARAAADRPFVVAFKRRLRRFARVAAVICALGVGAELYALATDLPRDRTVASLARGQFGRAARLAERLEGPAYGDIVRMAVVAGDFEDGSPSGVEREVEASLRAGVDLERVLATARVGSLRGSSASGAVASALEAAIDGDYGAALARASAVGGVLGELLATRLREVEAAVQE